MGTCRVRHSGARPARMAIGLKFKVTVTAPALVAAIDNLGKKMGKLTDDLVAAQAQSHADADAVVAALTKLGATIIRLEEALANQPDDAALAQVLVDMKAEHEALVAALASVPPDPPVDPPADPAGATGEASV